ncbi:MAG: tRNA 2-thiouridine(34) synthase MnmA [Candidatus Komeilibacteria bacterium]
MFWVSHKKRIKVAVGMSGGVDSSLAALLLSQDKAYDTVGVYMRNWSQELPEIKGCPWETDQRDARLVADQLGIPFYVVNFEQEYYDAVVKYMIDGYQRGITPNPDIVCNQAIKFGIFWKKMRAWGFAKIATGHYARIIQTGKNYQLTLSADDNKDQTYFLSRLSQEQIGHALFPLGDLTKREVRNLAAKANLLTAHKRDSQGVCFIGNMKVNDFLKRYISGTPGSIKDLSSGKIIGKHQGIEFFTIGQRQGIDIGGSGPYYVVRRDLQAADLWVTNRIDDPALFSKEIKIVNTIWQQTVTKLPVAVQVRIRHRQPFVSAKVIAGEETGEYIIKLSKSVRAVTPGQVAAMYQNGIVLGAGIIV